MIKSKNYSVLTLLALQSFLAHRNSNPRHTRTIIIKNVAGLANYAVA
ncbi:MAG: hypothetical protein V1721_05850 [Pseudomonadota bacterium]